MFPKVPEKSMFQDKALEEIQRECKNNLLLQLMDYYMHSRGAGHSREAVNAMLNSDDALLVVGFKEHMDLFVGKLPKERISTVSTLKRGSRNPIILDNSVMFAIYGQVLPLLDSTVRIINEYRAYKEETELAIDNLDRVNQSLSRMLMVAENKVIELEKERKKVSASFDEEAKKTADRISTEAQTIQCSSSPECTHCHLLELASKLNEHITPEPPEQIANV